MQIRLQIILKSHLKPLDQIKSNLARMNLVILNKIEFFGVQFNGSKSTFMNFKTPFMQFEFKILKTVQCFGDILESTQTSQ
jgi:hypothetical protein